MKSDFIIPSSFHAIGCHSPLKNGNRRYRFVLRPNLLLGLGIRYRIKVFELEEAFNLSDNQSKCRNEVFLENSNINIF